MGFPEFGGKTICPGNGAFAVSSLALKTACVGFPDPRKGCGSNIATANLGLSAFSMFFTPSRLFLSFQRTLEKGQGRSKCQSLFGIENIPSDNYIRDMLDAADPALLARAIASG